jgi:hypothetical protein
MNVRFLPEKGDGLGQNSCRISRDIFIEKAEELLEQIS